MGVVAEREDFFSRLIVPRYRGIARRESCRPLVKAGTATLRGEMAVETTKGVIPVGLTACAAAVACRAVSAHLPVERPAA